MLRWLRWFLFLLAILTGLAVGLVYGWFINPVEYTDTTLDELKIDYRVDYILMIAESFSYDGDLPRAILRLKNVADQPPIDLMSEALVFGERAGYTDTDIRHLRALLTALEVDATQGGASVP
jgi:hypothetical protein